MTKSHLLILKVFLISIITIGCSTSPNYVFYHSEAGIPQASKAVKSTFKLIETINGGLPFAVVASKDKSEQAATELYYILLSPPFNSASQTLINDSYYDYVISDYIHPYNVMISADKVKELIKLLDVELASYHAKQNKITDGISFEYALNNEYNIAKVSENVEQWIPNFKFILKTFNSVSNAFVDLGVFNSGANKMNYCYYLKKSQVIEFRNRLGKAVEILENWGMK